MQILFLYNSRETFTNTVFDHLECFAKYSTNSYYYTHLDESQEFNVSLDKFDAVVLHYSVRLPFNQISVSAAEALASYGGCKALFIQDEYDNTHRAWDWIRRLGIGIVFTVVPSANISKVYPPELFPGVKFYSILTGYVEDGAIGENGFLPPSKREIVVGYRGRHLPARYGALGQEKINIGIMVRKYCEANGIRHDIEWSEKKRIYGAGWNAFLTSCRSMLGSESGSNVFDWDGDLDLAIDDYRLAHPKAVEAEIYEAVVAPRELPGVMNQISPRVFETIAARTALVLFEGAYSGVVEPWIHYIPLKKDGSNLDEVFAILDDGSTVDAMTKRAHEDIICSGEYSYRKFVARIDNWLTTEVSVRRRDAAFIQVPPSIKQQNILTQRPIRALGPRKQPLPRRLIKTAWASLPLRLRRKIKPVIKTILRLR